MLVGGVLCECDCVFGGVFGKWGWVGRIIGCVVVGEFCVVEVSVVGVVVYYWCGGEVGGGFGVVL